MIPLRDNNPTLRFPLVTVALIVANVVVFLFDLYLGRTEIAEVAGPSGYHMVERWVSGFDGWSMVPRDVLNSPATAWPTLFTSLFLHAGWFHLGGNMLYLWIFGNNVEDVLGRARFLAFYLLCGLGASALHIALSGQSPVPTIGASGAVAGAMGAYVLLYPGAKILTLIPLPIFSTLVEVPSLIVVGYWIVIQFAGANWFGGASLRGGGVAYGAHVGGFIAGFVLILLFGGRRLVQRRNDRYEPDPPDTIRY